MAVYVDNSIEHINFIMQQKTKKLKTKIQYMDYADRVLGEVNGFCTGGGIDISNSDMVRRTLKMDFVADSKLEIGQNSPFWINKRLKVFTGIEDYNKNIYWFNQGVFVPTQPETSVSLSGRTISLSASDKMVLAENPVLMTTKFLVDTPIHEAIMNLARLYGETKFMMAVQDLILPSDYEMSAGDDIQTAIKEITNLYMNYETFYNLNGVLVYDKMKNRYDDNVVWDFSGNTDFTISRNISADYMQVFNDFVVYGHFLEEGDDAGIQVKHRITIEGEQYASHPFSKENIGRLHSMVIEEDKYTNNEQCRARAEYEKQQAENLINNFSITTVPIYSLNDVNRVVNVSDNGKSYKCLVDSISYPLDVSSPMTIACHEIFSTEKVN